MRALTVESEGISLFGASLAASSAQRNGCAEADLEQRQLGANASSILAAITYENQNFLKIKLILFISKITYIRNSHIELMVEGGRC